MLSWPPVLSNFVMVGITPCMDVYAIFRYEPMHDFSLGITNMMKECYINMLGCWTKTSSALVMTSRVPSSFLAIKRTVLARLNGFLQKTEKKSIGLQLSIDLSKGECSTRISGLSTGNGLLGMLQMSDFQAIDNVSPFLGAVVHLCCGYDGQRTMVYAKYV